MPAIQLIPKQTASFAQVNLKFQNKEQLPATIFAVGLSGADAIPIAISEDDGTTSTDVSQEGTAVELTVGNNSISVESPMFLTITKGTTAGTAGVFMFTESSPNKIIQ